MSGEEEDYSSLPLEARLVHKTWKARLEAYEESIKAFENSRSASDDCFSPFTPDLLKKIVTDPNVVAQQTGVLLFSKYLEFGATTATVERLKSSGVIVALAEKGLASTRPVTKDNTHESLMLCIEISSNPNGVVEDLLPLCTSKLPKLVAGVATALTQIVSNFGCTIIHPKPIIAELPKLFSHADKNVRNETSKLAVELYKWTRQGLITMLFPELKPIQQKDLTKAFEAIGDVTPQQVRLTRAQRDAQAQSSDNDVVMEDVEATEPPKFDAFDLAEPVEVLSKLPSDFNSRVNSTIWKDRKEVLEEVNLVLSKAVRLSTSSDYGDLLRVFAKCMRDANIQVVQLAANCVELIAKGLKKGFQRYQSIILVPMLERTKEKKPVVADALSNALDAIFKTSSLSDILDGTVATLAHKTPQVKISAASFLQRCLAQTTIPPTSGEVHLIVPAALKLLNDSQEPVRQAGIQLIGTLMKLTGERELKASLEKVDENRKAKIMKAYEEVQVKSSTAASRVQLNRPSTGKPQSEISKTSSPFGEKKARIPTLAPSNVIPSKRGATSPADRVEKSSYGRSLTGRSLKSNTVPKLSPVTSSFNKENETPDLDYELYRALKAEKEEWQQEKQRLLASNEVLKNENIALTQELSSTKQTLDRTTKENNNASLMVKQKDTQILRLTSDIENSKLKIRDLEQTIEMMKLQQKVSIQPGELNHGSRPNSPYKNRIQTDDHKPRISSGELSSRVNRLSIDAQFQDNKSHELKYTSPIRKSTSPSYSRPTELDDPDESWRKAAEITNQLKARIEKMKARSRATAASLDI